MNNLGRLLREAREEMSRQLGREVSEGDIAAAIAARGVPIERKTYSNIETGRTKTLKPEVAEAVVKVLPVSMLQIVTAMGFPIQIEGIQTEEEVEVLQAFREASDPQRLAVRGALLLPVRQPVGEQGRSLSRQVDMARRDRRGTRE